MQQDYHRHLRIHLAKKMRSNSPPYPSSPTSYMKRHSSEKAFVYGSIFAEIVQPKLLDRVKFLSIILLSQFVCVCQAIHLEAVLVPQYKFRGQNATLLCKYELEPDEELFSLKWYKEETEFYRFTPNDQISQPYQHYYDRSRSLQNNHHRSRQSRRQVAAPPEDDQDYSDYSSGTFLNSKVNYQEQQMRLDGQVQTWKVPGIKIDSELSTPQRVVLKRVSFKSTGMYRCEVTAVLRRSGGYGHIPIQSFKMKESINRMIVVELPSALPVISGGGDVKEIHYKPGDILNLTCTSAPSNPPAALEWTLNDKMIDPKNVARQHLVSRHRGLFSSTTGLLMTLEDHHFKNGEIRVKCKGTIAAEFWRKDVENVFTEKDRFVKVLEVRESQWPNSCCGVGPSLMQIFNSICLAVAIGRFHLIRFDSLS